jgi:hypothetical protein
MATVYIHPTTTHWMHAKLSNHMAPGMFMCLGLLFPMPLQSSSTRAKSQARIRGRTLAQTWMRARYDRRISIHRSLGHDLELHKFAFGFSLSIRLSSSFNTNGLHLMALIST